MLVDEVQKKQKQNSEKNNRESKKTRIVLLSMLSELFCQMRYGINGYVLF